MPKKNKPKKDRYTMVIERNIIDRLGLKLYDRVSAVVAEIIANAYDADAEEVTVRLPLGKALAVRKGERIEQKGYTIEVCDDGNGMTPYEANEFYLRVGKERRKDARQGNLSRKKKRRVMGRKGIGKLAPFGVCKTIEIYSVGGKKTAKGYEISHLELDYDDILKQTDEKDHEYHPKRLADDGMWSEKKGTIIRLKNFLPRIVPDKDIFQRQLLYRFLSLPDFRIKIQDTKKDKPEKEFFIVPKDIPVMEGTKVIVDDRPLITESGKSLSTKGWIAMSTRPYKNVEFAGVRIYTRGKIVAITRDFGISAGFSGEFVARSYLIGEIKADWIDEKEDLIQTHRQDILWSSEEGRALSEWGQKILKEVAKRGREPRRKKAKDEFLRISNLKTIAQSRFKSPELVKTALELGEKIGGFASEDELIDEEYVRGLSEIILAVAPHKLLVDTLKEIGKIAVDGKVNVSQLMKLFDTSRIAQLASYGQIVTARIKSIDIFEKAIRQEGTTEEKLQKILEDASWLIDPRWEPITANRSFKNFRNAFESWYKKEYKVGITTSTNIPHKKKRPDFILLHMENSLKIVEIKPPEHAFDNNDWVRLNKYYDAMEHFLQQNKAYLEDFPGGFQVILISNKINLTNTSFYKAMDSLKDKGKLKVKTWEELLNDVKKFHQSFLDARESFELS